RSLPGDRRLPGRRPEGGLARLQAVLRPPHRAVPRRPRRGRARLRGSSRRRPGRGRTPVVTLTLTTLGTPALLPLEDGEQYRFTFDMNACVGCHSCEVACAEQNGTPVDEAWRRVGELESGSFPQTRRFNLSMACNHCLEPTCLSGCPTKAYEKLGNGIVVHH